MPDSATDDRDSNEYNYCYCKEELGGEMIHCDNDNCPHGEWFRLSCLHLKRAPQAKKWYCPQCHKEIKKTK